MEECLIKKEHLTSLLPPSVRKHPRRQGRKTGRAGRSRRTREKTLFFFFLIKRIAAFLNLSSCDCLCRIYKSLMPEKLLAVVQRFVGSILISSSQPMVHHPVEVKLPFHRVHISDILHIIFIIVETFQLWSDDENNFMVGRAPQMSHSVHL